MLHIIYEYFKTFNYKKASQVPRNILILQYNRIDEWFKNSLNKCNVLILFL